MPIKAAQVAYTFSPDELKKMLAEQVKASHPTAKKIDISFNIGEIYDQFDRGGTSTFTGVTVTVHE